MYSREVSYEEGQSFAEEHGLIYVETSSKNRENINTAFQILVDQVMMKIISEEISVKEEVIIIFLIILDWNKAR